MSQPAAKGPDEPWSSVASTYSSDVHRTSSLSANRLLELANALSPISTESFILDNGAGTGAVTFAIASHFPFTRIIATDLSASMLSSISSQGLPGVSTKVLDARALSQDLEKGSFTHVFNTFMLQTITTPFDALREMHTVLKPGGVVGIGIWARRNGPFDIWEQACQTIDPNYRLPEPFDDPKAWRTQGELEGALKEVGFSDVKSEEVKMPFPFESAKAFVDFMFGGRNPAATKCMSNWTGSMDKVRNAMVTLVENEYADGKEIYTWAVLGVGRK